MSERKKEVSTRRRFLETGAALGTAAALGAAPAVHVAGDDTVRVGLIGCGSRGTGAALQALNADPGVRLVALADIFADHLASSLKRLRAHKPKQVVVDKDHRFVGFDAYRKVIESADAVLIACSSRFHPIYVKEAIEAGKHVFVEKPHAIDPPGVKVLTEACREAERRRLSVVSGLHRRYDPAIRETMRRVRDGAIGDIVACEVSFMRAPYRVIERKPEWSEIEWQFRTWYHFSWLSGDDVPQSLIHTIDMASWALGEVPPATCHALGGRSASVAPKYGNVFDHNAVVYEYSNGARLYGLNRTQVGCYGEVAFKLMGTKGQAGHGWIDGEKKWRYEGPRIGAYQAEQNEFIRSIRSGKPINNGRYMAQSTLIAIMGQLASYTGRKLKWKEVESAGFSYPPAGKIDFTIDPPVKPGPDGIYPVPVPGKTKI